MSEAEPRFPRRVFLGALLAAATAGGATWLGVAGALTEPRGDSFRFARGTSLAPGEEARLRGLLAEALQDTRTSVTVIAHTGTLGDEAANLALSEARAAAILDIARDVGLTPSQITATGVGGGRPFERPADTSARAHQSALARADVTLQVRQ